MRLTIQKNLAEGMRPSNIENDNLLKLRHLDDFGSVRSHKLAGAAGGFAARMGFEFVIAPIVVESFRPRLIWRLRIREAAAAGSPNSFFPRKGTQHRMAIRPTWGGFRRPRRLPATTTASAAELSLTLALALALTLTLALPLNLLTLALRLRSLSV